MIPHRVFIEAVFTAVIRQPNQIDWRVLHSLPWQTAGVIDARLPQAKPPTPFARLGNILPFVFALIVVAIAIALARKAR